MMDFGIYKLQREVLEQMPSGYPNVAYDWDADAIKVTRHAPFDSQSVEENERLCRVWIFGMRRFAFVDPETGSPFSSTGTSRFAELFLHAGFETTVDGVPDTEAIKELDKKFVLEMVFLDDEDGSFAPVLTCRGALLSNKVAIED
ncbi:hypothetical protein BMI91_16970 [Thioclava sediminum]|uniref:Uncharacterized protein n=2 Tax=Thioclava sediminum TaxID=1915319 RepID=A0ABX3MX78_9RHOB|nr:hypothetical protein BMI91_16970 [Thioclava sediminum]